eukprot:9345121-Pyramimonas_sp.AAC.1
MTNSAVVTNGARCSLMRLTSTHARGESAETSDAAPLAMPPAVARASAQLALVAPPSQNGY